jgi:hypothetical protein
MPRGRLRLRVSAFLAVMLAGACIEPTRPTTTLSAVAPLAMSDVGVLPNGTPLGIGGAYTLNVSGPYVTYRPPSPSGITLFSGIPVEVTVSGQITREMTDAFIRHCELVPDACPSFLKSNAPFGPGGLAFTNLGAATSWWDFYYGYYYYVSPGGSVAYRGLSGTNLLLGRTGLYCTWGHVFADGTVEQGDCYAMGGGFTYTVHAIKPPTGQAGLTLAITKNAMGPSGGPVDLTAATTDGSQPSNVTWYFVADAVTEETDPVQTTTAMRSPTAQPPLGASRSLSPTGTTTQSDRRFPAPGQRVLAIDGRTGDTTVTTDIHSLPAGDYLFVSADTLGAGVPVDEGGVSFAATAASAARIGVSPTATASASRLLAPVSRESSVGSPTRYDGTLPAPITGSARLDGCANSLTCSVNLRVSGGTFVVTGIVHGVLRAAEQRIAALPEDPGSKPRLYVIIEPKSDELLAPELHIPAGNCPASETVSPRRLHVFVIDSGKAVPEKVANALVTLSLAAVVPPDPTAPDAGGHVVGRHAGNPKPAGRLSVPRVVTDAHGDAYVVYRASEFGGKYEVGGTSDGAVAGADTITVGIALTPLAAGTHFSFIGQTTEHPINHFGTPSMNEHLGELADSLYAEARLTLEYNDISLPLGGRFEVADHDHPAVDWTNPAHCDHRFGRGADVRTNPFQKGYTKAKPSPTVKLIQELWFEASDFELPKQSYFWEGDHLHVKTRE